jgi:alkylhydroperoxidase family enzyme
MAFIRQIKLEDARGSVRTVYEAAIKRVGGIANIIRVMSLDANSLQASMHMYTALMKAHNALTGRQREMLATVVSNANACYY